MRKKFVAIVLLLLLAVPSYAVLPPDPPTGGTAGVRPKTCTNVVLTAADLPAACHTSGSYAAAEACADAMAVKFPDIFPGVILGYQQDGKAATVTAHGRGLGPTSVVSLASVSKPLPNTAFVKLVQDHYASPACTPMTANCIFPQKFETKLADALKVIDRLRGTTTYDDWFNRIDYADAAKQRTWKHAITLEQIMQMTAGFSPIAFTGYRFCPNGVCPTDTSAYDWTCDPNDVNHPDYQSCRVAFLYNQYLATRGPALPNGCKPRPVSGPRTFNFENYYNGDVDASYRLMREFERRYSFEPGLLGECVLVEGVNGGSWIDGRAVRESDIGKFYLGLPLMYEPGTDSKYAQPGFYIMSYLIESVSGQRFDTYLKNQILTPLGMTDTSFYIAPGSSQHNRLADIKRVPDFPTRVLPDIAAPVDLANIHGTDKNWDELRRGWQNRWPEGGGNTTAGDLLRFLTFARTGKTPAGQVLLNADSVLRITTEDDVHSSRTYAFATAGEGVLTGNGYFGTQFKRDLKRCNSSTVLTQTITESPEGLAKYRVQLCDYQFGDMKFLRDWLQGMLDAIPSACAP
ncbi:MAG TPA: serine hydrolase domain-containing protein [Thermoanaerobaculia bacterium]